ncbi:hypothetical protein E2F50_22250 [Rhizobium deserti]|uniref:Uncharacterized protein n=1 Tax=Rhizobium deserti TaxID=2547961 RepID=A0A4R5U6M7_9HYPH|nr:hypothetical protein [Rhizobium deserti]TDK29914.1 hypothetical protein E2F50_22250 [Rhizobium deserti]
MPERTKNFQEEYFDTVRQLAEALSDSAIYEQVVWKAEYLTRDTHWFHYYGIIRGGRACSIGHEYDVHSRGARNVDPATFVSTLMEFDKNARVVGYGGNKSTAIDILDEIDLTGAESAEIVRISIQTRETMLCGRRVMSMTDVAYVGFEQSDQGDLCRRHLKADTTVISLRWCRDRRFICANLMPTTGVPIRTGFQF